MYFLENRIKYKHWHDKQYTFSGHFQDLLGSYNIPAPLVFSLWPPKSCFVHYRSSTPQTIRTTAACYWDVQKKLPIWHSDIICRGCTTQTSFSASAPLKQPLKHPLHSGLSESIRSFLLSMGICPDFSSLIHRQIYHVKSC